MGSTKWIAGLLGWAAFGPIGALAGFALGAFFEHRIEAVRAAMQDAQAAQGTKYTRYSQTEQRNSFLMSLLVLSSAVIRADGQVRTQELDQVREFIRRNFGDRAVDEAMRMLDSLNRQQVDIYSVGAQIAANMNYSQRLQLFHYLARIADADRDFSQSEKDILEAIASAIRITSADAASVIAMYRRDAGSAYAVLEITPSATDDEVKAAYRRMAMKHHPDKVATLGPEIQKAAAEKFRKIQEAYEIIKKERNI